jgi:MscS family membrane protein
MKGYLRCLVLVLFTWSLASPLPGQRTETTQTPKPPHGEDTTEAEDPLGRSTPHGTVLGFLQAAQSGKNKEAAQYLQLSGQQRATEGERLAQELHALMDKAFVGRVGAISHHREGSVQPEVPQDHERIGTIKINGRETEVDLVRVTDASGAEIWLFSSKVLAAVPGLFAELEGNEVESRLPSFLVTNEVFSTPLWRVISLLLLIPVSFGLAWVIVHLLRAGQRLWLRWRHHPVVEDIHKSFAGPAILILTVVFNQIGVSLLGTPLLIREYYRRVAGAVLVAGIAWLIIRVINRLGERARQRSLAGPGYHSGSLILLGQRIFNVLVVIVAGLIMLSLFGVDITAAVAGLGIGSIAIAFAAQKTLENLLGGISILGDQVVRVGEVCRIGDNVGTVEDISLRSTRIRTLAGTALSVPNGQLANMNVENITRRRTSLFEAKIGLRSETSAEQLRSVVEDMRALLRRDPKVDPEMARVHFVEFGESSLDIEIHCLLLTGSLGEFLALREELLLKIKDLLAGAGVELATPARLLRISREQDPERIGGEWLRRRAS